MELWRYGRDGRGRANPGQDQDTDLCGFRRTRGRKGFGRLPPGRSPRLHGGTGQGRQEGAADSNGSMGVTDPAIIDFVTPRLTPHPPRSFLEPVQARSLHPDLAVGYVYCSGYGVTMFTPFYEKVKTDPRVRTGVIDTGHLCLLSETQKTR